METATFANKTHYIATLLEQEALHQAGTPSLAYLDKLRAW